VVVAIDNNATQVAVYQKNAFNVDIYQIDTKDGSFKKSGDLSLRAELETRNVLDSITEDEGQCVSEMRFTQNNRSIKCSLIGKDHSKFIDIDIMTGKTTSTKGENFENKSIYKFGLTYVRHHEGLTQFLHQNKELGNDFAFPE
jgi:hypothetical protein